MISSASSSDRGSTSRALFAVGGAIVIVAILAAVFFYIDRTPIVHTGQVLSLQIFPIHRDLAQDGDAAQGVNGGDSQYNEMIVLAQVSITNKSKQPQTLLDMKANVLLPNNNAIDSLAASTQDAPRVFVVYPGLASMRQAPLLRNTTIQPGQTMQGQLIFNYPLTQQQWNARKGLDLTVQFVQQTTDLHINLKGNASTGKSE